MRKLFADTTPLKTPDFRRLWLAGIVTVIGGNLTIFAVPVQLYALTESSAYVGLAGLFALVPLIVFGLWGGAWADAMDRRLLLIITAVGLAVSSVLLWLQAALALNNVWVVLCLLSLQQVFYAVNSPTRAAAIPRMLPAEQLPAANSLNMTVMQFGAIVGPLLAGVLLHFVDLSTLYLIDAITCITPIWATVRLAKMPPTGAGDGASKFGFRAVLEGFRYLAGNQVVLLSFVVDLIAMIFGMPRALFPQMAHESFGGPVEGGTTMALLSAAMSVWRSWRSAVRRTWCRRRSGRPSCKKRPPTTYAVGCRGCSRWWWPAVRGSRMSPTVRPPPRWGRRSPRPAAACWWSSAWCWPRWPGRHSCATGSGRIARMRCDRELPSSDGCRRGGYRSRPA